MLLPFGSKSETIPIFVKFETAKVDATALPSRTATARQVLVGERYATIVADPTKEDAEAALPIQVGVGVRLTAQVRTNSEGIDLSDFVSIGAAAQRSELVGTMTIQDLGIPGEKVVLPLTSDVSVASVQSAVQALGQIKGQMYITEGRLQARVLGFNNTVSNLKDPVSIVTQLLASPNALRALEVP